MRFGGPINDLIPLRIGSPEPAGLAVVMGDLVMGTGLHTQQLLSTRSTCRPSSVPPADVKPRCVLFTPAVILTCC